ncbi:MAG: hypothetical protein ACO21O_12020 [Steroidobacteraceae bacterium]
MQGKRSFRIDFVALNPEVQQELVPLFETASVFVVFLPCTIGGRDAPADLGGQNEYP